jgi:hypothetical protein
MWLLEEGGYAEDSEGGALGHVEGRVVEVEGHGESGVMGQREEGAPTFDRAEDTRGGASSRWGSGADELKPLHHLVRCDALREAGINHCWLWTSDDEPIDMNELVQEVQARGAREVANQRLRVEEGTGADCVGGWVLAEEGVDDELGTWGLVEGHVEETGKDRGVTE